ncbi:hypothetical protein D9M68_598970 [compost metagenome]
MGVAGALRRAAGGEVVGQVRVQQGDAAVVQGDIHRLPASARLTFVQRQENAGHRVQPGDHVDDRQADAQGAALGFTVHAHQSGHGLDRRVVARQPTERAVCAEAGHRAMDQAREALAEYLFITDAPARQGTGLEVLQQHVGVLQQPQQQVDAFRLRQVDGDVFLVAVDALEVGRRVAFEGRAPAAGLVTRERFQLDHLGTMVGQRLGGVGAAQDAAEVDDADAAQGALLVVHCRSRHGKGFSAAAAAGHRPG